MQMSTFSIVPSRHDHLKTQFLWSKLPSIQESVLPVLHHAPHSLIKLEEFPVQSIQLTVTKQHSENGSNAGLYCIKKKKNCHYLIAAAFISSLCFSPPCHDASKLWAHLREVVWLSLTVWVTRLPVMALWQTQREVMYCTVQVCMCGTGNSLNVHLLFLFKAVQFLACCACLYRCVLSYAHLKLSCICNRLHGLFFIF